MNEERKGLINMIVSDRNELVKAWKEKDNKPEYSEEMILNVLLIESIRELTLALKERL